MKRILVHMCCGPCSIYPLKEILKNKYEVKGFFYNPNIHPREEFGKRLAAAKELARLMDIDAIFCEDYDPTEFFSIPQEDAGAKTLSAGKVQKQDRCTHCYTIRMDRTARAAKEGGFDFFSSSLLYSRYQDHEGLISFGREMQEKYNVSFFYEDFRKGWQEGIADSKTMGLYRQKYCGCIYSKIERGL